MVPDTMTLRGMSLEELLAIPVGAIQNVYEARRLREVMEDKRPPTKEEVGVYLDKMAVAARQGPMSPRRASRQMNYELARIARAANRRRPRPADPEERLDRKLDRQLKVLLRKNGAS